MKRRSIASQPSYKTRLPPKSASPTITTNNNHERHNMSRSSIRPPPNNASTASLPFNSPFDQVTHGCCNATAECARLDKYDKGVMGCNCFRISRSGRRLVGARMECLLSLMRILRGRGLVFLCLFGGIVRADWCVQALTSYIMQASMVLYIWLAMRVLDYLPVTYDFLTGWVDKSSPGKPYRNRIRAQLIEKAAEHRLIA